MDALNRIASWRVNPVLFVQEVFGVEPDPWQVDVLMAAVDHERIAMKACAGPGKTAVEAWLGWWFMMCFGGKGEHPKGYALSCTGDNLNTNLWPELSKWQQRSDMLLGLFTWTSSKIFAKDHPNTWFLAARSFPKTANPEEQGRTLSGLHSEYVLILIDESGSIHPSVLRAAEQAMNNVKVGRVVTAGNTTSHESMLYAACTQGKGWYVVSITADPDDPKRTPRVSADWARDQIAQYGRDNPWVMAYILGQFPPSSISALLSLEDVERAMERFIDLDEYTNAPKVLGIDIARQGDDKTVIFMRQGLVAFKPVEMRNADGDQIAGRVGQIEDKHHVDATFVDTTGGWGWSAIDSMRRMGRTPIAVEFAGKAINPLYANKRTEIHFLLAEWVKGGGCLPYCPELIGELITPTYSFKGDRMILAPKEIIKKTLGRSPDLADSLALTFAFPVAKKPLYQHAGTSTQGRMITEED